MLIVQGFKQSIGEFGGRSSVAGEEGRALVGQDPEEVVQGHESQVGIRIIQLGKQAEDGLLGHLSIRHDESVYNGAEGRRVGGEKSWSWSWSCPRS